MFNNWQLTFYVRDIRRLINKFDIKTLSYTYVYKYVRTKYSIIITIIVDSETDYVRVEMYKSSDCNDQTDFLQIIWLKKKVGIYENFNQNDLLGWRANVFTLKMYVSISYYYKLSHNNSCINKRVKLCSFNSDPRCTTK